jgi:hypothetical protein
VSSLLRFENNPYTRRRNAKKIPYLFHDTNYGKLLNNAVMNFNPHCDLFDFRNDWLCRMSDLVRKRMEIGPGELELNVWMDLEG